MAISRTLPNPAVFPAIGGALRQQLAQATHLQTQAKFMPLPRRIGVIGNHLPRQCGIATFTTDLCDALEAEYGFARILAVPVTDANSSYDYPSRVQFELAEADASSFDRAKDFLNQRCADVVCLQHEFGIFGGVAGDNILPLLRDLRMPVVTTLHTVLREPDADQRRVMQEIADRSARLVVMSRHSCRLLQDVFAVPAHKIDMIHHGVPDLPFADPKSYKSGLGMEDKSVILSFGLLSPNKGVENIIAALPKILLQHRDVELWVVGATHPHLMRREGDKYRQQLQELARNLGVAAHVKFHHQFVSPEDMASFIGAADLYITPYRHEAQVSSGTLAYALGAGKAIISTPYWHAAELLADGRGALVPFQSPDAIATTAIELLGNDTLLQAMRKRAYSYGRAMVWKNVARQYMRSFQWARGEQLSMRPDDLVAAAC